MPIYQYQCRNCGANIEKLQSVTADPLIECPECHQLTLKKVLQPVGIIFKGSGWYVTDSKKSSAAVTPSSDGNSESKASEGKATVTTTSSTETKSSQPASTPAASATSSS